MKLTDSGTRERARSHMPYEQMLHDRRISDEYYNITVSEEGKKADNS